jgi:predicted PurR-regulated permease PerM
MDGPILGHPPEAPPEGAGIIVSDAGKIAWAQSGARIVLALALALLGIWTLFDFVRPLIWAGVLAIAVWPAYQRVRQNCPSGARSLWVPAGFTLVMALFFVVPLGLIATELGREAHGIIEWAMHAQKDGIPAPDMLARLPFGRDSATRWWQTNLADPKSLSEWLGRLNRGDVVTYSREFGLQLLHRIVVLGFTLMALFFLFRDGETVTQQMQRASLRAFGPSGERLGRQIVASVHGTVDGLVFVGIGEGVLLGIAYAVGGVPHPTLFGAVTAVAAMIPFGAPLVFGVAALLMLAQGMMVGAIALFVFGMAVVFVADHAIRPILIGGATRLPFLWVLLGILGGVESFGLLGLFLGPAIMAALILLWREWSEGQNHP